MKHQFGIAAAASETADPPPPGRGRHSPFRVRRFDKGLRLLAAALVVCVAALVPMPDAWAQATDPGLADVEPVRYGGADRYATSLIVAETFAEESGGKLDSVVVVSGLSWPDAVVSASVAGRMGAPVLLTPPDAVRDDALAYLRRVGASRVVLVSTDAGSERSIDIAVDEQLRRAGLTVERVSGADR